MGDRRKQALRVQFDGKLRLEFHGARIMSDAELFPFRELDEAFRLTEMASVRFSDPRRGKNAQHTMLAMLRQAVYGRLAGYEDVNDAERLRVDPAMRRVVVGRANEKEAASTSEMSRFETEILSSRQNLTALMELSGTWIDLVQECAPLDKLILDLDNSQSETYGEQQGSAYDGHFECTCFEKEVLMPIRITCRHKWLDARQVIEGTGVIEPWAKQPTASYTDRNQEIRILCGSV